MVNSIAIIHQLLLSTSVIIFFLFSGYYLNPDKNKMMVKILYTKKLCSPFFQILEEFERLLYQNVQVLHVFRANLVQLADRILKVGETRKEEAVKRLLDKLLPQCSEEEENEPTPGE